MIIHTLPADFPRSDTPGTFAVPDRLFDLDSPRRVGAQAFALYLALVRFAADPTPRDVTLAQLGALLTTTPAQIGQLLDRLARAHLILCERVGAEIVGITICPLPEAGGAQ
jgi:hypothetical protein